MKRYDTPELTVIDIRFKGVVCTSGVYRNSIIDEFNDPEDFDW